MKKPFFTANVRDILDLHTSGEISFSMMVHLFNSVAEGYYKDGAKYEVLLRECKFCKEKWVSVMPHNMHSKECPECRYDN